MLAPLAVLFGLCVAQPSSSLPTADQLVMASNTSLTDPYPTKPRIFFSSNGSFKIAVITDTHYLDGQENAGEIAANSSAATEYYLRTEKPNFVVHNGDLISGEAANSEENAMSGVTAALKPIIDAGLPFATTKGNHDNDLYSTHASITAHEHTLTNLSYTRYAPPGVGGGDIGSDNYWIPVYEHSNVAAGSRPALMLWFFDSRSGKSTLAKGNQNLPDWVDESVGNYITNESTALQRAWGTLPPSIVFTHVPSHDFAVAQQDPPTADKVGGVTNETSSNFTSVAKTYPGLNDDNPFGGQGGESPTNYTGQDRAYLNALTQGPPGQARIHAIISGHQHGNDWCAPSNLTTASGQTVPVCFAKHSGFGGYDDDNWNHGSRIFTFSLSSLTKSVGTHIRFLTGEKRYETQLDQGWARQ